MADIDQSVLLLFRIPLELRRHIYSYLLTPDGTLYNDRPSKADGGTSYIRDYQEYEQYSSNSINAPTSVLRFRNSTLTANMVSRTRYKVRSGRLRSACEDASYICHGRPNLCTKVFQLNRQIYEEAVEFLYGTYTFDFGTHIEACVPFLTDLTPFTRSRIRRLSIVKCALPYDRDFDRCEWSTMCDWLSREMRLQELDLGVVAGKPSVGWEGIQIFNRHHIDGIIRAMDEMNWVNGVANIRGLQKVNVRACIEHSPPPVSSMMAFFVAFSASVEPHFADYLISRMIAQAA